MIAVILTIPGDVSSLLDMLNFVAWMFVGMVMISLLVMRVTKKDVKREFKVTFCNINLSNEKSLLGGGGVLSSVSYRSMFPCILGSFTFTNIYGVCFLLSCCRTIY